MMGKCWENDGGSWVLDDFRVFPTTLATQIKHDSSMRRICERLVIKKIRRDGKTVCDLHLPVCSICSIFQTQNSLKYLKIAVDLYVNVTCWSSLVLCRVFLDHHRNQEAWVVDVSRGSCLAKMSRWCPICAELTGKASNMMVFQCIAGIYWESQQFMSSWVIKTNQLKGTKSPHVTTWFFLCHCANLREVKSFSTDDLPAAQSFFQTYGFVVFKDVLSAAECGCLNEFVHESVAVNRRDVRWGWWGIHGMLQVHDLSDPQSVADSRAQSWGEATVAEIWTSLEERTEGPAATRLPGTAFVVPGSVMGQSWSKHDQIIFWKHISSYMIKQDQKSTPIYHHISYIHIYPLFLMGMNSPSALLVVHHFFFPQLSFQDWRVTPPRAGPCCRRNATGCPKSRPWRGKWCRLW